MKILILTHEFPPVGGGGGRVAQDLASGLARRGHQVHVLTARLEGLPVEETTYGVHIQRIASMRREAFRATFAEMARYDWSALIVGKKVIRSWKPDVIHAHFAVPAGAAAFILSKVTGVPYLLTAHLGDVPGALPEKTDRWFKWVYPFTPAIWRHAAKVVAVSGFTRRLALEHYPIPIDVIPNGIDLKKLPVHLSANGAPPQIVFAGRFVEQKNPQHIVDALAGLKNLSWTCSMLGDGPLLESVHERVIACGLSERVAFPGWVTPEDVLNVFARSDILVLPSRSEGLSVVGVQALGMGLALVLSDAGGNSELVRDGENGFLFPSGDVEALSSALKKLLENRIMLQSAQQKSRELAQQFDLEAIIGQYEKLFGAIRSSAVKV
jgi:glycosyltransferase involved in cell wall biosynthesis